MSRHTILGRVTQLAKADVNALLDQTEDPQKMLDQLIRDHANNISEAEQAVATTLGNLRMPAADHREDVDAAAEWGAKALAASRKAAQTQVVDPLEAGLAAMKDRMTELQARRDELVARARTARAHNTVLDAVRDIDVLDPASDLHRFEEKVRREEAVVLGRQEPAASSLDAQFESLEELGRASEIEASLAALKAGAA